MFGLFRRLFTDTQGAPYSPSNQYNESDWVTDFNNRMDRKVAEYYAQDQHKKHREAQKRQARAGIAAIRRRQEEKLFSFFFDQADNVSPRLLTKIEKLILLIEKRDEYIIAGDEFWAGSKDDDIRPVIQELEQLRNEMLKPKDPEVEVKTSSTEDAFTKEDLREAKAKGWNLDGISEALLHNPDDTNLERFKLN